MTGRLSNKIHSCLTHILYATYIIYCILLIIKLEKIVKNSKEEKCMDGIYCIKVHMEVVVPSTNQGHSEVNGVLCKHSP